MMWWNQSSSLNVATPEDLDLAGEREAPAHIPVDSTTGNVASSTPKTPERSVNARFFFVTLGVGVFFLVGMHFLHAFQMQRISGMFLKQARIAAEADRGEEATKYLRQYLRFYPNDLEARVLLVEQLAKVAETPRQVLQLLLLHEGILRADPNQTDVRSRTVKLYLQMGQHRDALVHLEWLINKDPSNTDLLLQAAECHEQIGQHDQAAATYRQLLRLTPQDARVYERLAILLREQLRQPEAADQLIQELMDSNRRNALAYGVRARYRHRYGDLAHAARDARIAFQLDPQDAEILKLVAAILTDQLEAEQASDFLPAVVRGELESLLKKNPRDTSIIRALVDLDLADDRPAWAEQRLRDLLEDDPRDLMTRFQLADLLLVTNRVEESAAEVERLREMGLTSNVVDFLDARQLIVQERWLEAIRILETITVNPRENPEVAASVFLQLAQCYEQIGHHHRRLKACRDAVDADPHSIEAQAALAAALARLGRLDDAMKLYDALPNLPQVSLAVARMSLLKQLSLPPGERSWKVFDDALVQASRKNADPDETLRLHILFLVAQDQVESARRRLRQERNKRPEALPVWLLSAQLERWANDTAAAESLLRTAERQLGKSPELDLARLRIKSDWSEGDSADWVFERLKAWDDLPETYKTLALREYADGLEASRQNPTESLKLRLKMARLTPDDLRVWQRVLSSAFAAKDDDAARNAVEEIRRIEGDAGPYWRLAEADRQLVLARSGQESSDLRAKELLLSLRNEMPANWTISLRLAEIAERRGDTNQAIEHYKSILQLEMYHPQVVRRLVSLLSAKQRDAEAEGYLAKLQEAQPKSFVANYGRVAAEVALRSEHRVRALKLARQAVTDDADDPQAHLWLGQMLVAIGMQQEAEAALRKAIDLAPQESMSRVSLVRLLEQSDRRDEALEEIEQLRKHVPAEKKARAVAYCLELTGQKDAAYEAYRALAKSQPQNGYQHWVLAQFCLRNDRGDQAETILRKLLDPQQTWKETPLRAVRRSLARRLLRIPGYPSNQEVLALIETSLAEDPNSIPDLRMKAHLLAERPFRQDRLKAMAVFDQLAEIRPLVKLDRIQRIRLLQNLGRDNMAKEAVLELLSLYQDDPAVLRFGLGRLLDWNAVDEAFRGWLARLEAHASGDFSTIVLKARHFIAEGKSRDAVRVFEQWRTQAEGTRDDQLTRLEQVVASLMRLADEQEQLGHARIADELAQSAESLLSDLTQRKPERITWRIQFLTQLWRLDEAWQLLDEAWTRAPVEDVAEGLVGLLQRSRDDQRRYEIVREPLENALLRNSDSIRLRMAAATITQLCGEYDLAVGHYRKALKRYPNLIAAQNEIAVLVALRGQPRDHAEALALIDQAIHHAGPRHFLLDTKATVLLAMNQPREAIILLNKAISDTPSPAKYYHLMQAHLMNDQKRESRRVFQIAMGEGFSPLKLHPLERARAKSLMRQFQ